MEIKNFEFKGGLKKVSMALILLCLVAFGLSFSLNKAVGWVDFLVFSLYFTTLSLSGLFLLSLAGIVQASWLTPYKRIPEAMTSFFPVSFIMFIGMCFGLHTVYEWTHKDVVANDPILSEKVAWLNEPRFIITMVVMFVIWNVLSLFYRRFSDRMDGQNGVQASKNQVGFSAISMILFALTICIFAFDWIMSVEPHWFSTIFGIYVFAGTFQSGAAFITICVVMLKRWGYFEGILNENHFHDLGKWMFGMSVFWAYIWISQYLLIWYANIPEETEYYVLRHHHWNAIFFFNLAINFFVPFFGLMTRKAKRTPKSLLTIATVILIGHYIDLYVMVAPKVFEHHNAHITGNGIVQALQLLGGFGLFIFVVGNALSKRKIAAVNDPTFAEGSHLHQ